ncbi:hypothetical protein J6590_007004 [Homalodisca vitripennis]|nr:hypothetical protein J6590_007004 [Homalodisca vitripennis]
MKRRLRQESPLSRRTTIITCGPDQDGSALLHYSGAALYGEMAPIIDDHVVNIDTFQHLHLSVRDRMAASHIRPGAHLPSISDADGFFLVRWIALHKSGFTTSAVSISDADGFFLVRWITLHKSGFTTSAVSIYDADGFFLVRWIALHKSGFTTSAYDGSLCINPASPLQQMSHNRPGAHLPSISDADGFFLVRWIALHKSGFIGSSAHLPSISDADGFFLVRWIALHKSGFTTSAVSHIGPEHTCQYDGSLCINPASPLQQVSHNRPGAHLPSIYDTDGFFLVRWIALHKSGFTTSAYDRSLCSNPASSVHQVSYIRPEAHLPTGSLCTNPASPVQQYIDRKATSSLPNTCVMEEGAAVPLEGD